MNPLYLVILPRYRLVPRKDGVKIENVKFVGGLCMVWLVLDHVVLRDGEL